jgi:hypothetical protein
LSRDCSPAGGSSRNYQQPDDNNFAVSRRQQSRQKFKMQLLVCFPQRNSVIKFTDFEGESIAWQNAERG